MHDANLPLTLRVLTVNIHKGFGFLNRRFILHELREAVRSVAADIVFLQEVLGAHSQWALLHKNLWPGAPHYEFLADRMWPQFAYGRNAVYPEGHHGNALLSKFPIEHYENLDVSVSGPERRGMLHCVLRPPMMDQPVHAICVHLGLREAHRRHQADLLCQLIERLPPSEPVVVAGDFNDWRLHTQRLLYERAGLQEVYVHATGSAARTYPARCPLLQLDRIYVRNLRDHRPIPLPQRPWSHLSDHQPLAAELWI